MKKSFTKEELARARQISAAVRQERSEMDLLEEAGGRQSAMPLIVFAGIAAISIGGLGWWLANGTQAPDSPRPDAVVAESRPPTRPGEVAVSSRPPAQRAPSVAPTPSPAPVREKKTFNSYVTRTTPTKPSRPASTGGTAPRSFSESETHENMVSNYAERYFRKEYRLGSLELVTDDVLVTLIRSEPIPGWSQMRIQGNVEIRFYNRGSGVHGTTRRGFEAISENRNGVIEVVDFSVKGHEYRP